MRFEFRTRTELPICVGKKTPAANLVESSDYIPGSTVKGAIAGLLISKGMDPNTEEFKSGFIDGQIQFGNLYPSGGLPVPMTAQSCKRNPGFSSDKESLSHGVRDTLLQRVVYQLTSKPSVLSTACPKSSCSEDPAPYRGYYTADGGRYRAIAPRFSLSTHSAIDRASGTVEDGALFSIRALSEGQEFGGEIWVGSPELSKSLIDALTDGQALYVGTGRSRGRGMLKTLGFGKNEAPSSDGLKDRVDGFNKALNRLASQSKMEIGKGLYFSLTLASDAIIQDIFMRYSGSIEVADLVREFGDKSIDPEHLKLIDYATEQSPVGGWDDLLGLPRETVLALSKGSTFVYRYTGPNTEALLDKLSAVEDRGLGIRKVDGFGRVQVCSPFHWEVEVK